MVTVFSRGGVSISAKVWQAELEQSCYQQTSQELCDGNCQPLHIIPHFIQNIERNVLHNGLWMLEIRQSLWKSFGWFKSPSRRSLHLLLLPQSCLMHCVLQAIACVQGTYVVYSSKCIQWCWGMYLLRGEINPLVLTWTGMLVEFHQNYHDFDYFDCDGGQLKLWLSLCWVVQTRHILDTIRATRRNGKYIRVLET